MDLIPVLVVYDALILHVEFLKDTVEDKEDLRFFSDDHFAQVLLQLFYEVNLFNNYSNDRQIVDVSSFYPFSLPAV